MLVTAFSGDYCLTDELEPLDLVRTGRPAFPAAAPPYKIVANLKYAAFFGSEQNHRRIAVAHREYRFIPQDFVAALLIFIECTVLQIQRPPSRTRATMLINITSKP
jgi:hypothetical protein